MLSITRNFYYQYNFYLSYRVNYIMKRISKLWVKISGKKKKNEWIFLIWTTILNSLGNSKITSIDIYHDYGKYFIHEKVSLRHIHDGLTSQGLWNIKNAIFFSCFIMMLHNVKTNGNVIFRFRKSEIDKVIFSSEQKVFCFRKLANPVERPHPQTDRLVRNINECECHHK